MIIVQQSNWNLNFVISLWSWIWRLSIIANSSSNSGRQIYKSLGYESRSYSLLAGRGQESCSWLISFPYRRQRNTLFHIMTINASRINIFLWFTVRLVDYRTPFVFIRDIEDGLYWTWYLLWSGTAIDRAEFKSWFPWRALTDSWSHGFSSSRHARILIFKTVSLSGSLSYAACTNWYRKNDSLVVVSVWILVLFLRSAFWACLVVEFK